METTFQEPLINANTWYNASLIQPIASNTSTSKIPNPYPDSQLKYDKTPAQFQKHMTDNHAHCIVLQNADQKQRREAREQAQKIIDVQASHHKLLMFHWEEDIDTGIHMHSQVYHTTVPQFWA